VRCFPIQCRRRSSDGVRVVVVDGDVVLAAIPSPLQVAGEPTDMPFAPSWRMKGLQTELCDRLIRFYRTIDAHIPGVEGACSALRISLSKPVQLDRARVENGVLEIFVLVFLQRRRSSWVVDELMQRSPVLVDHVLLCL
jgi:hypothetical protein